MSAPVTLSRASPWTIFYTPTSDLTPAPTICQMRDILPTHYISRLIYMPLTRLTGMFGFLRRFLQAGDFLSRSHELDLFEFCPFHSKKRGHLDDLSFIHEVFWIRAEFSHRRAKIVATHSLRDAEAEPAFTSRAVMRT